MLKKNNKLDMHGFLRLFYENFILINFNKLIFFMKSEHFMKISTEKIDHH